MTISIRIRAAALFLIFSPVLASCQAMTATSTASPKAGTTVKSQIGACLPGAQDEMLQPYGPALKMMNATNGWAVAQCGLAAMPAFEGGSTIQCQWPRTEAIGILRTTDGGATWTDVSPPSVPNRTWHHGEFFLDANHAWVAEVSRTASACVSQVTTFRTSDGGRTWQQAGGVAVKTAKPTDDIFNVCCSLSWLDFVDSQHGWLLVASPPSNPMPGQMTTPSMLYATSDGGMHWSLVTNNPGSAAVSSLSTCRPDNYYLAGMKLISAKSAWMLVRCPGQTLLLTQDGGTTWKPSQLPECQCNLQPFFFDSNHGAIAGGSVMLTTTDGGASWTEHPVPSGAIRQFSFTDANRGWLVAVEQLPTSYDTAIHRTTDGGRSWTLLGRPGFATPASTKNAYYPIISFQFVDANTGFVALSALGGSQVQPDPFGPQLQLLSTQDGGRSWKVVLRQVPSHPCLSQYNELQPGNIGLSPVKYANATTAWARGGLRTIDGGAHWRDVSSSDLREGVATALYPPGYAEFFLDGDHAWQSGVYGSATTCSDHVSTFATADGGKTWQQSAPIALNLASGYRTGILQLGFLNAQSGWLWVPIVELRSYDSWFGANATAGHLFATADGGRTWRRVGVVDGTVFKSLVSNPNCGGALLGQVTFSSSSAGWMTLNCVSGKFLVTKDGGVNWAAQPFPVPCECSGSLPTFVDPQHGFMQIYNYSPAPKGPTSPTLVSTSDGGNSWRELPPVPSAGYTMAMNFADASNLWALVTPPGWNKGSGGKFSLYRSKDGGASWAVVEQAIPVGRAYALLFADEKHGMVAQPRNATWTFDTPGFAEAHDIVLAVTSDGGHTWKVFKPAIGG